MNRLSVIYGIWCIAVAGVSAELSDYLQPDDVLEGYKSTNPSLCLRKCTGEAKICYYKFHLEAYVSMGDACGRCPQVQEDCFRPQCVQAAGFERGILTANRRIPGTSIQVCKGDRVIVDVINQMPAASTTIHWHGISQKGAPYMDGVPMVSQCPISPSDSFRYDFTANETGTFFWHSHSGFQKIDGLFGSIIVRQKEEEEVLKSEYDEDLPTHVIEIIDWMTTTADQKFPGLKSPSLSGQRPSTYLINGRGVNADGDSDLARVLSSTHVPVAEFQVEKGKRYRFRSIASQWTNCPFLVTIQNHSLNVIASDGQGHAKPTLVDNIAYTSGERYDFVLTADQKVGSYWMIVRGLLECEGITQAAILRYRGARHDPNPELVKMKPKGVTLNLPHPFCNGTDSSNVCVSELQNPTAIPLELTKKSQMIIPMKFGFRIFDNDFFQHKQYVKFLRDPDRGVVQTSVNDRSFVFPPSPLTSQYEDIPKELFCENACPNATITAPCQCLNVIKIPLGTVVDLVVYTQDEYSPNQIAHPFHLHGYHFYVIEEGVFSQGYEKGLPKLLKRLESGAVKNPTPVLKDTIGVPGGGYTVLRFKADNPGFWHTHCHIAYHSVTGMNLVLQVGELYQHPTVPKGFPKCGSYLPSI